MPFEKLAYVLRVDGGLAKFGQPGLQRTRLDKKGEYLSMDIVVDEGTSSAKTDVVKAYLVDVLRQSLESMRSMRDKRMRGADFDSLSACVSTICSAYARDRSLR